MKVHETSFQYNTSQDMLSASLVSLQAAQEKGKGDCNQGIPLEDVAEIKSGVPEACRFEFILLYPPEFMT